MAKNKQEYVIGILEPTNDCTKVTYVTSISLESKIAKWEDGKPAKVFNKSAATDIAFALCANCHPAVVIQKPEYLVLENPKPKEKDVEIASILKTEYSNKFDDIRKKMMATSYYKYGPMRDNYSKYKCMDAIGNIEKRLETYKETANTEYLADVANFAMIEFMYPSIPNAKYKPTDGGCETVGFSINEVRNKIRNK